MAEDMQQQRLTRREPILRNASRPWEITTLAIKVSAKEALAAGGAAALNIIASARKSGNALTTWCDETGFVVNRE